MLFLPVFQPIALRYGCSCLQGCCRIACIARTLCWQRMAKAISLSIRMLYVFNDKTATIRDIDKVIAAPDSAFTKNVFIQEVKYGFSRPSGWCKFEVRNISTSHRLDSQDSSVAGRYGSAVYEARKWRACKVPAYRAFSEYKESDILLVTFCPSVFDCQRRDRNFFICSPSASLRGMQLY